MLLRVLFQRYRGFSCAGAFRAREMDVWQIVLSSNGVSGGYTRIYVGEMREVKGGKKWAARSAAFLYGMINMLVMRGWFSGSSQFVLRSQLSWCTFSCFGILTYYVLHTHRR